MNYINKSGELKEVDQSPLPNEREKIEAEFLRDIWSIGPTSSVEEVKKFLEFMRGKWGIEKIKNQ